MAKGKSKSTIAPNVKAAVCTAALLASGASAKGLRQSRASDKEVVVASFHLSSKQDLSDDPPPNLTVTEKVIAETAPFQMIRQKRSMEMEEQDAPGPEERKMKTKKAKKAKKEKKKAESSDSSSSSSDSEEENPKKRKAK